MWHRSLLTTLLLTAVASEALGLDVYIVTGQSNGYRLSSLGTEPKAKADAHKVYYYGMDCVSEPESSQFRLLPNLRTNSMGYGLADALRTLADDDIIFIQYCRCGAAVGDRGGQGWYPGDDPRRGKVHDAGLFGKFVQYVAHARESAERDFGLKWKVKGLFWHQGESDSSAPEGEYERNLSNLFWRFRETLGKELPIVAAHIRSVDEGAKSINSTLDKLALADGCLAVVPSNDLKFEPDSDGKPNVHFALDGCLQLGRRMAGAYRELPRKE